MLIGALDLKPPTARQDVLKNRSNRERNGLWFRQFRPYFSSRRIDFHSLALGAGESETQKGENKPKADDSVFPQRLLTTVLSFEPPL